MINVRQGLACNSLNWKTIIVMSIPQLDALGSPVTNKNESTQFILG